MVVPPKRKIIIIDGVTNTGKTTIINCLRKKIPGSSQFKFSDYYHKSVQRKLGVFSTEIKNINEENRNELVESNIKRYLNLLNMVEQSPYDDYLIERLHPTDYVYQIEMFGKCNFEEFKPIEEKLNKQEAELLLLTIDDNILKERMENTLSSRNRKYGASFDVPEHILSYDSNRKKRDLYLDFFSLSNVKNKHIINNSNISQDYFINILKL
jgi:uridine kinase